MSNCSRACVCIDLLWYYFRVEGTVIFFETFYSNDSEEIRLKNCGILKWTMVRLFALSIVYMITMRDTDATPKTREL